LDARMPKPTRHETKKKSKKKMIAIISVSLLVLIGIALYMYFRVTNFNTVKIDQSDKALGITQSPPQKSSTVTKTVEEPQREDIVNIALFGVDRRNMKERGRSDSMMIATVDFKHKKIKLTSLMRDMYTPIEGHGNTKLNHAYAYGGPELAIKTINQNLGTNIRDYVTVDFFTLEKIIDAIGGVQIDIKPQEVSYVNDTMRETANIEKKEIVPIEIDGIQTLNGMQAVAYARIRHIDGDFERTERQRRVLTAMLDKVQSEGKSAIPQLLLEVTPYIETTLTRSDLLSLGYDYFKQQPLTLEQQRFPMDGEWNSAIINGGWYMKVDWKTLKEEVSNYIYEDINPSKESNSKIESVSNAGNVSSSTVSTE
jgi:LCP family protein required for cell wall assembly